jgi:hypothetical protein
VLQVVLGTALSPSDDSPSGITPPPHHTIISHSLRTSHHEFLRV